MPEKILGMSINSNERVSELLCQKKLGKNCVKNGDYLQYLLIKNGYIIIMKVIICHCRSIKYTVAYRSKCHVVNGPKVVIKFDIRGPNDIITLEILDDAISYQRCLIIIYGDGFQLG
jgi:hypothetical protein